MRHFLLLSAKTLIMLALIFSLCLPEALSSEQKEGNWKSKTPVASEGSPKIQFFSLSYDFGKVFQNKSFDHIFTFKNIGTANLEIIKVKAG